MQKKTWFVVFISLLVVAGVVGATRLVQQSKLSCLDALVQGQVETSISMLDAIADRQASGEITMDEAQDLGAALLRNLSYGDEGYFWADTTEGVNVVLYGRSDVEGRNRLEDTDVKGNYFVKSFISTGLSGGGFVDYWFVKINETDEQAKRSYVQYFEPFDWVIGSGYYH